MKIEITGLDTLSGNLASLASTRLHRAVSMAIGKTTVGASEAVTKEIADSFVGPIPLVQRSVKSRIEGLSSAIWIDNSDKYQKNGSQFTVAATLAPHVFGGTRRFAKLSEMHLRRIGVMGAGQYIVPSKYIEKDPATGNVTAQTMTKVLSAAGLNSGAGYSSNQTARSRKRNKSAMRGVYCIPFVGIFQHTAGTGSGNRRWASVAGGPSVPLLFFTYKAPQYEQGRFDFFFTIKDYTKKNFAQIFNQEFKRAMER